MNVKTKRAIASRLLLAVLLPTLLLSWIHVHPLLSSATDEECADCVQHHCGGHIGQQAQTLHECVICQFLSLPKVAADAADAVPANGVCKISYAQCQPTLPVQASGVIVTRGPPAV